MDEPTSAIITSGLKTASSIGAGLIGLYGAQKQRDWEENQARIQRDWNESMADKQNAWNYEMWLKQNEYNTPEEQVKRLRDAGLNPLYYGLDGSSAGELTAAQPLGYERASASAFTNPIQAGLDAAIKVAQISNIQADTAKKGEETRTEVVKREKLDADIRETNQTIDNLKKQGVISEKEAAILEKNLNWIDQLNQAKVDEANQNIRLSRAEETRITELLPGEKEIQDLNIEELGATIEKIRNEIAKIAKEKEVLDLDVIHYLENHMSGGFMGTGLSLQNFIIAIKSALEEAKNKPKKPKPAAGPPTTADSNLEDYGSVD